MISSFTHPTHGPLTVHERIGRSRRCQKEDGTSVTISVREINKLVERKEHQDAWPSSTPPEDLLSGLTDYLNGIDSEVERVRVAKDIWRLAEGYLQS